MLYILNNYKWPGNIRELENLAIYLAELGSDIIDVGDLPANFGEALTDNKNSELSDIEVEIIKILYSKMLEKEKIGRNSLVSFLENRSFYCT